jgi:hypothetical protein
MAKEARSASASLRIPTLETPHTGIASAPSELPNLSLSAFGSSGPSVRLILSMWSAPTGLATLRLRSEVHNAHPEQ